MTILGQCGSKFILVLTLVLCFIEGMSTTHDITSGISSSNGGLIDQLTLQATQSKQPEILSTRSTSPGNVLESLGSTHSLVSQCIPRSIPRCNPYTRFRTANGVCNNLADPFLGSSNRAFKRYLPPAYNDGFDSPRTRGVGGLALPSARAVSNMIHRCGRCRLRSKHTVMFMNFGLFVTIDLSSTAPSEGPNGASIECCGGSLEPSRACYPIRVPFGDPRFRDCLNFVRSAAAPNENCQRDVRQQLNRQTSFLDGSQVYGADRDKQHSLRTGIGGRMRSRQNLLAINPDQTSCVLDDPIRQFCFDAGDARHTLNPIATPVNIVFLREHNRIARALQNLNPYWSDERIFQEARKIIVAVIQHITYNEYIESLLGRTYTAAYRLKPSRFGYRNIYSPNIDPTLANGFAAAALRLGHSEIPGRLKRLDRRYRVVENVPFENHYLRPGFMFRRNGVEDTIRWGITGRSDLEDRKMEDSVRQQLLKDIQGNAHDLAATNVQRGRDHGLPPYNNWRRACRLRPVLSFAPGPLGLQDIDPVSGQLLSQTYNNVEDLDLFTAGLAERHLPGAVVGPTFACILAKQFQDLQLGDRFYYENNSPLTGFSRAQLQQIKQIRLSSVLCKAGNIGISQRDVFLPPSPRNRLRPCSEFPQIDLNLWKEHAAATFQPPQTAIQTLLSSNGQLTL